MSSDTSKVTREDVLKLMDEKKQVEAELEILYGVIKSHNADMDTPLVDSQGYPRSDIDVYQVRHARSKINRLSNDLKAVMSRIESGLHCLHAQAREEGVQDPMDVGEVGGGTRTASAPPPDVFAKIDVVTPGSPAEMAGLVVGDRVAEFGSVSSSNFTTLKAIGEIVQNSKGSPVTVKVVRGSADRVVTLTLTPREWSGRGLLGCNIVPLEIARDR